LDGLSYGCEVERGRGGGWVEVDSAGGGSRHVKKRKMFDK